MGTLSVRIPDELHSKLKELKKLSPDNKMSSVIRDLLEKSLRKHDITEISEQLYKISEHVLEIKQCVQFPDSNENGQQCSDAETMKSLGQISDEIRNLQEVYREVDEIRADIAEIKKLRGDLVVATRLLLHNMIDSMTEQQAEAIVQQQFGTR